MGTRLFVGSLAWATDDAGLRDHFAKAGGVVSATVIMDRASGRSKGFGFVEMESADAAQKAIAELNGSQLDGRSIAVSEARPKEERS